MEIEEALHIAKQYLGDKYFNHFVLKVEKNAQSSGLYVCKKQNEILIQYSELCELFRGLTLIKENHHKKEFEITLKRNFSSDGLMLDCSRNGVVNLNSVKHYILNLALMGHNRLLMYTEDTYEMEKYPYFGYMRGAYSKEELKELVEYGNSFGVELVPCIQTLDHLERPLRWEVFDDIKDGPSNVCVGLEKTYEFIEEMIKTSRECFTSKDIHIGMDESFNMGLGKYLYKNGYHDRVELFCKHLGKVIEICKKYDFLPMIWSDMFFRLNDKGGDYYSGKPLPKETLDLIPEDVGLVYWDYYHDDHKTYDAMISSHLETKRETYFAGGSWRWSGFAPALHKSYEFSKFALESAVKNGLKNVFVTAWGDNGNECSIYPPLLVLAEYSVFDYNGECNDELVDSLLSAVAGENKERMLLLDLPNMPAKKVLAAPYNPDKFFFYQDPLSGIFDDQVKDDFASNYREFAKALENASKESEKYSYMYHNLALVCSVLELKVDLGVKLRKAYKNHDNKTLKFIKDKTIKELLKRIELFHSSLQKQWNLENKRFGFDVLDGRIGYLKQRLITTQAVINDYLKGNIEVIDELEKEILPYNGHDFEICWNHWITTVTVNGI